MTPVAPVGGAVVTRLLFGGLCSWHGLAMLFELPARAMITGSADWPYWWAAVAQWAGGILVAAGVFPRRVVRAKTRWRSPLAGTAALVLVASVTVHGSVVGRRTITAAAFTGAGSSGLWAQRPRVALVYTVAPSLRSVAGRETGTFTPDLPTCELVFRSWPNNPTIAKTGAAVAITGATIDGQRVRARMVSAGAPASAPPTMLRMALPRCVNAGQPVGFDVEFGVTLGSDADERVGFSPSRHVAWFGSAFPMLSWVRGRGWSTDSAVSMNGETAVSEEFALQLTVIAPRDLAVQGVGAALATSASGDAAMATHRFTAEAVRDVSVAVGRYRVLTPSVNGVRLHLAIPTSGSKTSAEQWVAQLSRSMNGLAALLGSFPYQDFWVSLTPGQSDGTEFPTTVQFSDTSASELPALVTHEVAHQWFYSLVGNNQAADPWLDEALATYGEAMVGGDADEYTSGSIPSKVVGLMGQPMSYWPDHGGFDRYTEAVYNQGASVLLTARQKMGAERFDNALRGYIAANAHRVAAPADFERAFQDFPEAVGLLRQAGAFTTSSPAAPAT